MWFYPRSGEHFQVISMFYVLGTVVPWQTFTCLSLRSTLSTRILQWAEKEQRAGRHAPFSPHPQPISC